MDRRPFRPVPAVLVVVAISAAVFLPTRPSGPAGAAPTEPTGASGGTGAALYGRDCAGCHGPEGGGSPRGIALTDVGEAGAHYALVTGRMPIDDPDEPIRRSPPKYPDEAITAIVDHVAGFGDGPRLPDIDVDAGDVPRGGELYRHYCGMCHSATGIGGALAFDEFAPHLMASEPSVVAAAMLSGPGAMPSFTPLELTGEEVSAVAAYVQQLQEPRNEGGWPIFRAGRADEGLVAWAVGIPILLVLAAWVGRRVR